MAEVEVKCSEGKLHVPSKYMDKDPSLKFKCEKCGGTFTFHLGGPLTDRHTIPCGFCGTRYSIAFIPDRGSKIAGLFRNRGGKQPSIESLIKTLDSDKPDKIREAAIALGDSGDPAAIEPLLQLAKKGGMSFESAKQGLALLGELAVHPVLRKYGATPIGLGILQAIGEVAVEPAIAALQEKDMYCGAIEFFQNYVDDRSVIPLLETGKKFNSFVLGRDFKAEVKRAIRRQEGFATEPLIAALDDEHEFVRNLAREILRDYPFNGDPRVKEALSAKPPK